LKNKLCAEPPEQRQEAALSPEQQEHWGLPQQQPQLQPLHPQEAQALEGTGAEMAEACAQYGPQQSLT